MRVYAHFQGTIVHLGADTAWISAALVPTAAVPTTAAATQPCTAARKEGLRLAIMPSCILLKILVREKRVIDQIAQAIYRQQCIS